MKPLNGVLVVVTVAILAAPSLAGATAATFKRITPSQKAQLSAKLKAQLSAKLKAPGLQPVKRPALTSTAIATAACELTFRQIIKEFEEEVSDCESLDRPEQNSPIYMYNHSTPSQQFALCQGYADEYACFNQYLINEQHRYCFDFHIGTWLRAERTRADCLAK